MTLLEQMRAKWEAAGRGAADERAPLLANWYLGHRHAWWEAMELVKARTPQTTICAAMSAYLAAHDPTGALPDDTAVIETIDNTGGPGVVITAGMIRAAVGEGHDHQRNPRPGRPMQGCKGNRPMGPAMGGPDAGHGGGIG